MKQLTKTNEERVFKTPRMEGIKVTYSDNDGSEFTHTIIKSKPSVATIVRSSGTIAFILQFRSTTGKYYIELPGGLIEEGETEVEAAIRETREETGLLINNAYVLVKGPSLLDSSKSTENFGAVVADLCGRSSQNLDENEQISSAIIWMTEGEVYRRVYSQLFDGEPFYNTFYLNGHSLYALMAYMMSHK